MTGLSSVPVKKSQVPLHNLFPEVEPQVGRQLRYHQKTISTSVSCQGIGVHTGREVKISLHPALSGSGITFVRTDLDGAEIKAHWKSVVDTRQSTTIGNDRGVTVSTVEHLLAALASEGIDNVRVEIDGPELPIMDGSAAPFVELLKTAGMNVQKTPRRLIRVLKPVIVEEEGRMASLTPSSHYEIEVDFDFAGRIALEAQSLVFRPLEDDFAEHIAGARTFGLLEDAEKVWALGLAKGASLENTVVFDGTRVMNEDGLRFEDECVRHKVLDVLGDLHLAGGLILGKFKGVRTGHGLHYKLLSALLSDPTAWKLEAR